MHTHSNKTPQLWAVSLQGWAHGQTKKESAIWAPVIVYLSPLSTSRCHVMQLLQALSMSWLPPPRWTGTVSQNKLYLQFPFASILLQQWENWLIHWVWKRQGWGHLGSGWLDSGFGEFLSAKGQRVNLSGFVGHEVSVTTKLHEAQII